VPDLQTFRKVIGVGVQRSESKNPIVVVPSRAAARQLTRTLLDQGVDAPFDAVDRDQLYDRLHARLQSPPRRLHALERDAIAQASARASRDTIPDLPFRIRPGLVAEMLAFYDLLRRQSQQVERFEALIEQHLAGQADSDPGAERMLRQTRFLATAFREYERRVARTAAVDEHGLRARLIAETTPNPVRHVIVAVPDWIADPKGLFVADFDLLSRVAGLEAIDIVATDAILGSGFHERLHSWLPGLEEVPSAAASPRRPRLLIPAGPDERPWFTYRDREEELLACARTIVAERRRPESFAAIGVVFRRPLPYLYLADDTLGAAGIPFELSDALPLAAESTAAALDLVLDVVASDFSRSALVALLRSPHFQFGLERPQVSVLDRVLSDGRYLGGRARLEAVATDREMKAEALPPLAVAIEVAAKLQALTTTRAASIQLRALAAFFQTHNRPLAEADPLDLRERRARTALLEGLEHLAIAHETHDDPPWTIDDVTAAVHRWIEGQTFAPDGKGGGVQLLDDHAARFGTFDELAIVGLIEGEWPDAAKRNIFYPSVLMKTLGWPSEKDRRAAEEARFIDLLSSPSTHVRLSTITLDDEALVEPSSILDEIPRARLSNVPVAPAPREMQPLLIPGEWADARAARLPPDSPAFHGSVGPLPQRAWSISALETYLGCPFKFFAQHILRLEEEPDDEEVMDPRHQGLFVHAIFERFFNAWQAQGGTAITPSKLDQARELFKTVVDDELSKLPMSAAEAGLERTRLLGSPAAAGLGEAVLRMEAERPVDVVARLLEHRLDGPLTLQTESGTRVVEIKGKADRLDLLADATIRLVDYKLGWPPQRPRALQLPIYGLCAEQQLARTRGEVWTVGEAMYLAFKGPRRVVPLFNSPAERADVLSKAQTRMAGALDRIERGEFPPTPDDVFRCETCSFSAVCRKDYVGDV
jgi:RecB family exonuclease